MITFVRGNLFDSPAQVLTNAVNTVGVMGKGIALEFKRRYPAMFQDYVERCKVGSVEIGKPYLWEDDEVQILNFPTKKDWRRKSRLEYIESGLQYLANNYQAMGIYTLALAPLGCGNGGLDWRNVKPLMEHYLGQLPGLEVFAYLPPQVSEKLNRRDSEDNRALENYASEMASMPSAEP